MDVSGFRWNDGMVKEFMHAWNSYKNSSNINNKLTLSQYMQKFKKVKTEADFVEKIKFLKA